MRALLLLLVPTIAAADGAPTPSPPPKTLAAAVARCAKHDAKACIRAGDLYQDAFFSMDSKPDDYDKSFAAYHAACDLDDLDGCRSVAWWYGENRNYAMAVAMLEPLCRTKDVISCTMLGNRLEHGEGAPADVPRALALFEQSCTAATGGGCLSGCNNLGFLHEYDRPEAKRDPAASLRYYGRACDLGCYPSCDTAGGRYRDGFGGPPDPARSVPLFKKACDGGFAPSCEGLSALYAAGSGVAKSAAKAKQLHARACRLSDNQVSGCRLD